MESQQLASTIVDTLSRLAPLDRVPRSGYLLRGVTEPESVAAHGYALALLALMVCDSWPGAYDAGRAMAMALLHDAPEVATMDVPMPAGDARFRAAKEETERAIAASLFAGFGERYRDLYNEYADGKSPEARLVRGLDKVQMMIRILCYQREGRGRLEEFWTNPENFRDNGQEPVRVLFQEVARRAGRKLP